METLRQRLRRSVLTTLACLLASLLPGLVTPPRPRGADDVSRAAKLEIRPGDHICIVGNTLAERMQHDGWLETLVHSRFPRHDLVIRNLGYSADELTLRPRSKDFGSPDDHLTFNKADVVFAFFGFNESFAGEAGLERYRADLESFVDHVAAQRYNGSDAPDLVLFSSIPSRTCMTPACPTATNTTAG